MCTKSVRFNQKALLYDICNKWFHLKCIAMDPKTYFDLGSFDEKWFYDRNCGWPFNIIDSFFESSPPSPPVKLNVSNMSNIGMKFCFG